MRAGAHDFAILCAFRFGWTPEQVDALPMDYADELKQALHALAAHEAREAKRRVAAGGGDEFAGGVDAPLEAIQ